MPGFAVALGNGERIVPNGPFRLEPGHGEAKRGGNQDEVALLKIHGLMTIDLQMGTPLEDHAVERLPRLGSTNTPSTGAADQLRELGARLKQRDDLSQWIFRTIIPY